MNVAIQIQPYNYPHVTWLLESQSSEDKLYVTASTFNILW